MCGHPQEGPTTPHPPPDRSPPASRESPESKKGARMIVRFEDDIANYIKEHQQKDPSGTRKFKKTYIEKQINCISMPGSALETLSEALKNDSCHEVHSSKKMRFYQCTKGNALERIILLFENDEHCRKSTEEIKELVETAYDLPR
jgi:hypothetical protein